MLLSLVFSGEWESEGVTDNRSAGESAAQNDVTGDRKTEMRLAGKPGIDPRNKISQIERNDQLHDTI